MPRGSPLSNSKIGFIKYGLIIKFEFFPVIDLHHGGGDDRDTQRGGDSCENGPYDRLESDASEFMT